MKNRSPPKSRPSRRPPGRPTRAASTPSPEATEARARLARVLAAAPAEGRLEGVRVERLEQLPRGHFRLIYADPPWKFSAGPSRHPDKHYRTMKLRDLMAMPVRDLAHPEGCRLVFWTTAPFLKKAFALADEWGFGRYSTARVWLKLWPSEDQMFIYPDSLSRGTAYEAVDDREFLLICKRGKPERIPPGKQPRGSFYGRRGQHSEKPAFVRDELARLFRGPRLELFSRHDVEGWTMWGDQAGKLSGNRP